MKQLESLERFDEMEQCLLCLKKNCAVSWLKGLELFESDKRVVFAKEPPTNLSQSQTGKWVDIYMQSLKELDLTDQMLELIFTKENDKPIHAA